MFRGTQLAKLLSYWQSLCKPDQIPHRRDFDPMKVPKILPFLSILVREEGEVRYRLTGTQVDELIGELRYERPVDLAAPPVRESAMLAYDFIFSTPVNYLGHGRVSFNEQPSVPLDHLLLPLQTEQGLILLSATEHFTDEFPMDEVKSATYTWTEKVWISPPQPAAPAVILPAALQRAWDQLGTAVDLHSKTLPGSHGAKIA